MYVAVYCSLVITMPARYRQRGRRCSKDMCVEVTVHMFVYSAYHMGTARVCMCLWVRMHSVMDSCEFMLLGRSRRDGFYSPRTSDCSGVVRSSDLSVI